MRAEIVPANEHQRLPACQRAVVGEQGHAAGIFEDHERNVVDAVLHRGIERRAHDREGPRLAAGEHADHQCVLAQPIIELGQRLLERATQPAPAHRRLTVAIAGVDCGHGGLRMLGNP